MAFCAWVPSSRCPCKLPLSQVCPLGPASRVNLGVITLSLSVCRSWCYPIPKSSAVWAQQVKAGDTLTCEVVSKFPIGMGLQRCPKECAHQEIIYIPYKHSMGSLENIWTLKIHALGAAVEGQIHKLRTNAFTFCAIFFCLKWARYDVSGKIHKKLCFS